MGWKKFQIKCEKCGEESKVVYASVYGSVIANTVPEKCDCGSTKFKEIANDWEPVTV